MSNVFSGGQAIISRLTSVVTDLETVKWASAITGPNSEGLTLPAAFVQPGQGQGDDDTNESDVTRERQYWQVGLRVAVDPAATVAQAAEITMGALIYDVIVALRGYQFSSKSRLAYTSRTEMQYPAGTLVGEVWLTFEAVVITRRT